MRRKQKVTIPPFLSRLTPYNDIYSSNTTRFIDNNLTSYRSTSRRHIFTPERSPSVQATRNRNHVSVAYSRRRPHEKDKQQQHFRKDGLHHPHDGPEADLRFDDIQCDRAAVAESLTTKISQPPEITQMIEKSLQDLKEQIFNKINVEMETLHSKNSNILMEMNKKYANMCRLIQIQNGTQDQLRYFRLVVKIYFE